MSKTILSVAIFAASFGASYAQAEQEIEQEIITTATRTAIPVTKTLASVSVLTAHEIEKSQAVDLPSLLVRLPGIDVDHNGGRGANASFRIRGSESDHVLILVDGVRTASASNGATAIQHIPLHQIERIEVVRGPRSSLYGAEAIGGVIQMFTKKGKSADGVFKPNLRVEYGSHNTKATDLSVQGRNGDTYYSATASHEETDGINRTVGSTGADVDTDGYRETAASLAVGHTFGNDLNVETNYLRSSGNTEFDSGANDSTDFTNEAAGFHVVAPLANALTARLELGYSRDDSVTEGSNPSVFETTRNSALLQFDYELNESQTLTLGYDYYNDQVDSTAGFIEDERNNKALFAQYLGYLGDFSVQASLREDDNEAFGREITGNAALGYRISSGLALNISYGEAFKAPTFNDLYFPFTDYGFGFTFEGNPDLKPEFSETWEVALRKIDDVRWSFSVYQTDIENLISLAGTTVENINAAEILGADAGLGFEVSGWQIDLSLSYVDAVDAETESRLQNRARVKANLDISRSFGSFDLAVSVLGQGDRLDSNGELPGYGIVNLRGSYQFTDELSAGFNVGNLFDKEYTLISGFRTFRTEGQTVAVFINYAL